MGVSRQEASQQEPWETDVGFQDVLEPTTRLLGAVNEKVCGRKGSN